MFATARMHTGAVARSYRIMDAEISDRERQRRTRRRAMSINEFCQYYGIGRTTAYAEIRQGRLRGRKIGKRTIVTEDDAEAWLRLLPVIEPGPMS